ncbi:unnamed protein product [Clonostachys solani]|uniref:Fungal N-terminal domain-containing protein n=1 Tax=Clonostachys solani TaxID=160281 RepID=A0A9N9ZFG8_9HYPO|nr:unnamed protein product [Clonostachys solani]
MNPLSITASTLTVIQAVGVVTIGVGTFVHSLRTIDSRLTGLYDELSDLQGNLKTIENTLIGCKDIDLSLIDDAIWHQSEIAIGNCQATVNDLARLVDKIKEASRPGTIGWKVQAIFELKVHERDLAGFRDKVHQSNSALQTMLHIIVVSLSLRQNASQSQILTELSNLKQSINNTWNASSKPTGDRRNSMSGNRLDNNITRDLRHLAAAAETFYATASSTAGTLKSDDGKSILNSFVGSEASGVGDLPYLRYQLLEQYLHNLHSEHPSSVSSYPSRKTPFKSELIIEGPTMIERANKTSTETKNKPHHPDSSAFDIPKEEVDDSYFEDVILEGMRELAIASIKALDFDEAIRLIKEVVCDGFETKRRNFDYFEIFSQLILCYFFKGEWRLAEPLVNLLSESNEKRPDPSHELIIYNFSHALSLCYLAEYSFERALEYCKRALYGKRRLYKAGQADGREYEETLGLYATIYEVSGDCIRAEIFRRQLLAKSIYIHPENVVVFFQGHEKLLASILGSDDIQTLTGALLTSTAELAASPTDITHGEVPAKISGGNILRMKLTGHEMLDRDTAKEAVVDTLRSPYEADDELSPTGPTITNPQSPKEKSPIRRHLTRIFKPRSSRLDTFGSAGRDEGDLPMINSPPTMKPSSRFRLFSHRGPSLKNSRTQRRGHAEIAMSDEMGRTTCSQGTSTARTGQRILDCVQETADHTSVDELRNSDSGSYGTRGQQLKASSHLESVDTSRHELGDTSLPAELGDTSPPDQRITTSQATKCEDAYEKLDNIIESGKDSDDGSTALDPELTSERPPATHIDPNYDHDAKESFGIDSNRDKSREEQPRDFSSRFEHCRAELWFGDKWAQALQNITSQLAIHLSSINGNQDLNSLQYHNQALTELFPSFKALSSDPNMVNDIRVAMFSLRKKIKELPQGHEDSGYESSQNSRDKGTASIDSTETKLRRWIRPCHPPASRNTDYAQTQENAQTQEKVQSPHPTADHSLETQPAILKRTA